MALVSQGFSATLSLVDKQNDDYQKVYELQGADYAAAVASLGNIITFFTGVSDLVVSGYILRERVVEDALVTPTVGNATDQAFVTARKSDTFKHTITIPAPKDAIFVSATGQGNNVIDTANTALLAYMEAFVSGGQAFVSDGEFLAGTPVQITGAGRVK